MAYLINNYDGSPLVNVQDRTLNITATSLKLPGRDYRPYGETMVENLIYMLQHFAQGVPPQNPVNGQIWFDTSIKQLKVYDQLTTNWIDVGSPQSGTQLPPLGGTGQLFYHTVKRQMFVWDANAMPPNWRLVGPVGAFDNTDPQTAVPIHSAWEVVQVPEVNVGDNPPLRTVWRLTIAGSVVLIVSQDTFNAGITGFADPIRPGINLRSTFTLVGTASQALTAVNSQTLDNIPASRFMRTDGNNVPDQSDVRSLGSVSRRYASMHAVQFLGEATTAVTATTAVSATTAVTATNAVNLNGEPHTYYTNATNLATGTVAAARLPTTVVTTAGATMTGNLILNGPPTVNEQAATKAYVDSVTWRVFDSGPFNIANSGTYPLTHGLGGVPKFVTMDLINITAEAGYSPGDVIQLVPCPDVFGATEGTGIKKSSTTVTVYVGQDGPGTYVQGDGTGNGTILQAINWQMVVRAYR